ncbi:MULTISPECIES: acyltransferase [Maribacter]|uniref:Acyltransferase n=1 Tax=Maribacter flavus TaxID=1658664 RepID=A0ABU7IJD5_9FLAO|nr:MULTISPECIES: acyltransferase [Maribacter]MDC6405688.1 acyltransferase [Maribacter sp. PR66]MEE1973060.1 acyltransferase [Maribacter flavus]
MNKFNRYLIDFRLKGLNVEFGSNIVFKSLPQLILVEGSKIIINDNTVINSQNSGYHLNMFKPCKLIADRPNSEIIIGKNCRIHGTCIHSQKKIIIGDNCLIAANCQIMDSNGHDLSFEKIENRIKTTGGVKEVVIEDNVWLGTGVVVLPGVTIGYGSVISANSVVHKSIPPMVVAGGNPIKIIKDYSKKKL